MPYRRTTRPKRPDFSRSRLPVRPEAGRSNEFGIYELERIPLPTEEEKITLPGDRSSGERKKRSFSDILPFRIGIEELLILGLIFILFQEGIDDDFLILLLLYILFMGLQ